MKSEEINRVTALLERWVRVASRIEKIEEDIVRASYLGKEELKNEKIDTLKMCILVEDKIYQEIEVKISNVDAVSKLAEKVCRKMKVSESVLARVYSYLLYPEFTNPFCSHQRNFNFVDRENRIAVINQYTRDYSQVFGQCCYEWYHRVDEAEQIEIDDILKSRLKIMLMVYHRNTIFENKGIEMELIDHFGEEFDVRGKERCLLFGQAKELVDEYYFYSNIDAFNEVLFYLFEAEIELDEFDYLRYCLHMDTTLRMLDKGDVLLIAKEIDQSIMNCSNYMDPKFDKKKEMVKLAISSALEKKFLDFEEEKKKELKKTLN